MIGERASKVVLPKAVVGLWLLVWWVVLLLGSVGPVWGLGMGDRAGQGALSAAGRGALVGAGLGMGNEALDIAAEELMKHVGGLPSDLTACEVLERLKNAGLIGGGLGGLGGGAAKALSEMDWRKLLSRFRNSDEAIEALNAAKTTPNAFDGVASHELSKLTSKGAKDWVKGVSDVVPPKDDLLRLQEIARRAVEAGKQSATNPVQSQRLQKIQEALKNLEGGN